MAVGRSFARILPGILAVSSLAPGIARSHPVVLNEVMFAPASGGPEWIELWNLSDSPALLEGWTLEDARGKPVRLSSLPVTLPGRGFLVLAQDAPGLHARFAGLDSLAVVEPAGAWPSLNNNASGDQPYADRIVIRDAAGHSADSLAYGGDWGVAGSSLERLDPNQGPFRANWCSSLDPAGGTPGRPNSLFLAAPVRGRLAADPDPFCPERDGVTVISFRLSLDCPALRLQVFDVEGMCVRTLLDERPAGRSGRLAWDGSDESGRLVATGIYVLLLEALDAGAGASEKVKGTVVVRRAER